MKLSLQQVDQAYAACLKIKDEKLNIKTAYKLLKLANELEAELKNFEQFSKDLILKYCEKDSEGNPIINNTEQGESVNILDENKILFQQEINELNNTEIDIKDYQFNFEDFNCLSISISELNGLIPFIEEEERNIEE